MYLGAWASGMSAWTGNRTGTKGGAQSEREGAGAQKERARRRNKGRRERKSASFRPRTAEFEMHELFVARKVGFIERKCLLLQANKHNISLFLPQCGVHIAAIFGRHSPECQRKCSLTYCKKARCSTGEASGLSKISVIRLRSGVYSEQNRLRWIDRGHLGYVSAISQRKVVRLRVTSHSAATDGHHQSVESGHRSSEKRLSNARLCGLSDRARRRRRGKHLRLGFRCRGGAPH